MDYSLLLAIHKVEETSGGVPRYKRSNSEPATDRPSTAEVLSSSQLAFSPDEDTKAGSPGSVFMPFLWLLIAIPSGVLPAYSNTDKLISNTK